MDTACLPKFKDENLRIGTFSGSNISANIFRIVKAGFHLSSNKRDLICHVCGISTDDYSDTTNFVILHLQISPTCNYLKSKLSSRDLQKGLKECTRLRPIKYCYRLLAPAAPQYSECLDRFMSLKNYKTKISKKKLSRSGFYCENNSLRCFECGVELFIEEFENPWRKHCSISPRCKYLHNTRGYYYIQKYS